MSKLYTLEEVKESFRKLEELQKKADYYKELNRTITPHISVEGGKDRIESNQNKDDER